jgi:homeobox-leucine zipper protein
MIVQLEKLAEMLQEPAPKYSANADAGVGDDSRKGVITGMKEEFSDFRTAPPYSSVEGGGAGGGKIADDDAGGLFRPSAGVTVSGPLEHLPFQFHNTCWPPSAEQTTCSSSQWWEFESLSE